MLDQLSHRERTVLELRYGLAGDEPLTLEDVGRHFGVTRERIRQIESRTLMKLKAFRDSGRLKRRQRLDSSARLDARLRSHSSVAQW